MEENGLIFRCFASGSSGNCYYLGTRQRGILIDAGISARQIQKCLREMNLDFHNIMGVLITHDHADHIRAVGTLGERVRIPIYSTQEINEGIAITTVYARNCVPAAVILPRAKNGNSSG